MKLKDLHRAKLMEVQRREREQEENSWFKNEIELRYQPDWLRSCDNCQHQEGRHYCLLHAWTVTNMDVKSCDEWEDKRNTDNE